jgi:hypothetical protein
MKKERTATVTGRLRLLDAATGYATELNDVVPPAMRANVIERARRAKILERCGLSRIKWSGSRFTSTASIGDALHAVSGLTTVAADGYLGSSDCLVFVADGSGSKKSDARKRLAVLPADRDSDELPPGVYFDAVFDDLAVSVEKYWR